MDLAIYEEFSLIFREIGGIIICYVYKGSSNLATNKINSLLAKFDENQSFLNTLCNINPEKNKINLTKDKIFENWLENVINPPQPLQIL